MFLAISTIFAAIMAITIIFVRIRATRKPVSFKKLILPPFFMSTGFAMFIFPVFRVSFYEAGEAFLAGMVFSLFLIFTSKFEKRGNEIYLIRSRAFIFILIGLFLIRLIMKIYLEGQISYPQTSGLFFIIAFGMILPWRLAMVYSYQKFKKTLDA